MSEDTVRVWIKCTTCGAESEGKQLSRGFVEMCERAGQPMRPSQGRCPTCWKMTEAHPMYEDGAF